MEREIRAGLAGVLACGVLSMTGRLATAADGSSPAPTSGSIFDATPAPYSLLNPVPDDKLRAFTPDRPTKATAPITVDAGRFQIESDFLNYSETRGSGVSSRTFVAADPVLKLGVTSFADVEITLGGYTDTRTRADGSVTRDRGFGDLTLSSKINLLGNDGGGKLAFALEPYLVVPAGSRNISAGQVEGGLIAPLQISLPSDFSLNLQTEVDALANETAPGTHVAFTNIATLSHPIPGIKDLTGIVEFYSQLDTERHSDDTYTFDTALAYLVTPDVQLDIGANFGLSRGAPDEQVYGGIAHRF